LEEANPWKTLPHSLESLKQPLLGTFVEILHHALIHTSFRFIGEIETVLNRLEKTYIRVPHKHDEASWNRIVDGFSSRHNGDGHPDVAGAIDGTLLEITRPEYFEGFYCRKGGTYFMHNSYTVLTGHEGFPAYNLQAIVDATGRFMSYSIRPGSFNDQMVLSYSWFGKNIRRILPVGLVLLGDSGYKIRSWMMVPFDDTARPLSERESL
jgi:hypothetical protein